MAYTMEMSLICFVAVLILVSTLTTYLKAYLRSAWLAIRLPGPYAWPVIGNAHWAVDSNKLVEAATECPRKYGLLFRAWLSIYPVVFIIDPEHIQKVLSNPKHVEKTSFYKMMHNFLGTGLITSDAMKWKLHRKLMQPYFHIRILEDLVNIFGKAGENLAETFMKQVESGNRNINVNPFVNKAVFSLLADAILGVPIGSETSNKYEKVSPYRQGSSALFYRLLRPWLLLPSTFNITNMALNELQQKRNLYEFTKKAVEDRKRLTVKEGSKCFIDHLLQICADNPDDFSEDDCVHEACTLMLAGQDSVGAALAFTIHLLANHPEHQKKVIDELDLIFEGSHRPPQLEDLKNMTYLEQCIKESLRLYPSVPIFARTLGQDLKLGKWTLPKGCDVFISPFATHRLPEIYPNPAIFDPNRFNSNITYTRPPFSFLPFSAGQRNCIGYKFAELEMKAALSSIFRRFSLAPVPGKETLKVSYRITLRATGGIWVKLSPRN